MTLLTVLLVLWSLNESASEVYHITTNTIDPSCTGPCLTLSQFATNSSHYVYSNTTLIFLPGTHYLYAGLIVSNVDNFVMEPGNSTALIMCKNYSNIYFNHSYYIQITNLEFIGCGGNRVKHVVEFVVKDTMFEGQGDSETALELIETTAEIVNSTFVLNIRGSYRRCILFYPNHDCIGGYIGGAIISTNSTIEISLSNFEYNGAYLGGAIFAEQYSIISMSGNQFIKNTAVLSGVLESHSSTITIEKSEFHHNSGEGILYSSNSTITIETSAFYENNPTRRGGVVESESSIITVKDSEFCNTYEGQALDAYNSAIMIDGTKFRGQNSSGTALSLINTTAQVVNSTFISNRRGTYRECIIFFEDKYHHDCTVLDWFIGGAIIVTNSTIDISQTKFEDNEADFGGAIFAEGHSNISMSGNLFINNSANLDGGALLSYGSTITIETSEFHCNSAIFGGVVYSSNSTITISASEFHNNSATWGGGVLEPFAGSTITIEASGFHNNSATIGGVLRSCNGVDLTITSNDLIFGGPQGSTGSTITIEASEFHENTATSFGGVLYSSNSAITIDGSSFINNSSPIGAVIYATNGSIIHHHNYLIIDKNLANMYAVIYLSNAEFKEQHNSKYFIFSNNLGSLVAFNSNITFISNVMFVNNHPRKATTGDFQEGGAVTLFQSNVFFDGICNLEHNYAENGGAIHSTESKIFVNGNVTLLHNRASKNGGGVYLSASELNCQQKSTFILFSNSAAQKGGGLHAISSSIKVTSAFTYAWVPEFTGTRMNFTNNAAKRGGGLSLEANAKLYILKYDSIIYYDEFHHTLTGDTNTTMFITNNADYGGAVYVDDDSNSGTCANDPKTECFFQVLALYDNPIFKDFKTQSIYFSQNYADISGSTLYGGLLDRCAVSQFAEVNYKYGYIYKDDGYGIAYFKNVSFPTYENSTDEVIISINISVASDPVRVCLCINNVHDCTHQSHTEVKKGEIFTVSLVAIDQIGQPVSATIQSSLNFADSGLAEGQLARKIPAECTNLSFNIISQHNLENLTLYASDGPCKDVKLSIATVEVTFIPCSCPIGLQVPGRNKTNCTCECHNDISQYVEKCDSHTGTLVKRPQSRAWISYINDTDLTGYLVYPNCPFDYCLSASPPVDLNQPDGADAQCAFNRSSLLCGSCQPGLSLSLGSSRCLSCPSYWPALLVSITVAAILAGIALVTLLLILNMTVAVGTLNGLIFYANVVHYANKSILLSFQKINFITVFISWLNLDLGIDTCYFPGMDSYIKTWLQLAFPAYVILLVVIVITISSYSTKFSNLIGRKNPVATLATLILLSYAKFLEVSFKSLSVGILEYPDKNSSEMLWLPDATVKYLSRKHLPLFIVTILIMLVGLVYTALLFSWQCILCLPRWRIFSWSWNPKIQTFIETYHMPYTPKHRYWTGLLLIVRIILYLIAAANVSNNPAIALTAILFMVCCIVLLKGIITSKLHKNQLMNILETFFYFNILFFAIFTWYSLNNKQVHQEAITNTSVIATTLVSLLIILCHVYTDTRVFSKIKKTKLGRMMERLFADADPKPAPRLRRWSPTPDDDNHRFDELMDELDCPVSTDDYSTLPFLRQKPVEPTVSVVEVYKPHLAAP